MKWFKRAVLAVAVLLAALALVPLFVSLDDYRPRIEKAVADRLQEPVSIGSLRFSLLPLPHVTAEGITVGKAGDLRAGKVTLTPALWSLLGETKVISSIDIDSLALTQAAVDKLPAWTKADDKPAHGPPAVVVQSVRLDNALLNLDKVRFGPFDARASLNLKGEPEEISLKTRDGGLKALVKPDKGGYLIDASAKAWKLPAGPAIVFDELLIKGAATLSEVDLKQIDARLYGGAVAGRLQAGWQKGLRLKGDFTVSQVELKNLAPLLAPGRKVSGRLSAKPVFSASAPAADQLLNALRLETPFDIKDGVLYGVDIEKAATNLIRRESGDGGETRFDQLSGHLAMERGGYRFTQIKIASGALAADGNVSISPKKELSGRINAEIKAGQVASAGVPLNVTGTVDSPLLLPTGITLGGAAAGTAILGPGLGTALGAQVGGWTEGLFGRKQEKK